MATLQEIIDYSKRNPNTVYAKNAWEKIQSGAFDSQAAKEGVDLSWAGRPKLTTRTQEAIQKIGAEEIEPEEKGFLGTVKEMAAERLGKAKEAFSDVTGKKLGAFEVARRGLRTVGQAVGLVTDVAGAGISEALSDEAKQKLGTVIDTVFGGAADKYAEFKQKHPEAAKDIEAIAEIGGGATLAEGAAKTALGAGRVVSRTATSLGEAAESALKLGQATRESLKSTVIKKAISPQLETSANRLFMEGTKRVENPVKLYDEFVAQSKKAASDIKQDPAISIVGGKIGDAFDEVIKQKQAVGRVVGDELKKVGNIKTDLTDVQKSLSGLLDESGLVYDPASKALKSTSGTKLGDADIAIVNQYRNELRRLGANPTLRDVDALISRASQNIVEYKASSGLLGTTPGERIVKQSLEELREKFNPAVTGNEATRALYDAKTAYSDLKDFTDEGAKYLGKITQSGEFAKDAGLAKSAVQSIVDSGRKDWLSQLEGLTGYRALDESVLALQAMKDVGDFRGLSILQSLSDSVPTSKTGFVGKIIDYGIKKGSEVVLGSPEEQTRAFLQSLMTK